MNTLSIESLATVTGGAGPLAHFNPMQPGLIHQMVPGPGNTNLSPMGNWNMRAFGSANDLPVGAHVMVNGANGISTRAGTVDFKPYGGNTIRFNR